MTVPGRACSLFRARRVRWTTFEPWRHGAPHVAPSPRRPQRVLYPQGDTQRFSIVDRATKQHTRPMSHRPPFVLWKTVSPRSARPEFVAAFTEEREARRALVKLRKNLDGEPTIGFELRDGKGAILVPAHRRGTLPWPPPRPGTE